MNSINQGPQIATFELLQLPLEIRRLVYYYYFFNDNSMCQISIPYQIPANIIAENDDSMNQSHEKALYHTATAASLRSNVNAMPLLLCSSQM